MLNRPEVPSFRKRPEVPSLISKKCHDQKIEDASPQRTCQETVAMANRNIGKRRSNEKAGRQSQENAATTDARIRGFKPK